MSDDDDIDYGTTKKSARNLATLFQAGEPATSLPPVATTAYVPPKQPKKESSPRMMIANVIQAFSFGNDQKWSPRGKMGVALLSTDNTSFQLILYVTKTQQVTTARISTSSGFTCQTNNYLAFQDDNGVNWSIMFDNKQAIIDFLIQVVLAKAYLHGFKFDHLTQEIREGEGSPIVENEGAEITVSTYKLSENGTFTLTDNGENKPIKVKIGKQQHGKAFDDALRGMKKNGQRLVMIGNTLHNIEILRIKREKETRTSSISMPTEEPVQIERKPTIPDDHDNNNEKNTMSQRIRRMGGVSMLPNPNANSAFLPPNVPHLNTFSDDDSIINEYNPALPTPRSVLTPVPPVQFVPPNYYHPQQHLASLSHYPPTQPMMPPTNLYAPQQPMPDYNNRSVSSMGHTSYPPMQPTPQQSWPPAQYAQATPTDMFYQQQQQNVSPDFRQILTRLNEKVDVLTDKFDTKINAPLPNMETNIVLGNIQRIVKENETMKKELYDRSAKVEELNLKITELLDRNQKLIEQSHQTFEQRNVVVNNVSEQTAQKILDLEKQKVELTNNLSVSTSRIADLQLQLNQISQDQNENQSRLNSLLHQSDHYREQLDKSESQRTELQTKLDTIQEQLKTEKLNKKQLQNQVNQLEEELAEIKITVNSLEKTANERKMKQENERKRWQDDLDELKQTYEKELDELKSKLRKQRTNDNLTSNQEITRLEEDLEKQWKDKFERQQTLNERILTAKNKEIDELKTLIEQTETKLQETVEELNQSQNYEELCEKLQERLKAAKEKFDEMKEEHEQQMITEVKRTASVIFQHLKRRIRAEKRLTGEEFLSRSLEIIKKATLKILSNTEEEEEEESQSEEEEETKPLEPVNGKSVDQQTLSEEISSIPPSNPSELTSETHPKNGWDTVDELQEENPKSVENVEQSQTILVNENISTTTEEQNPSTTIEETPNDEKSEEKESSDTSTEQNSTDEDEIFHSARPSIQEVIPTPTNSVVQTPRYKVSSKIPLMGNADESDDEMFK